MASRRGASAAWRRSGIFRADLTDLHDAEIEFLQFNERGKLLVQRILSINAGALKGSGTGPDWWAH